jgi:cytochrome P450
VLVRARVDTAEIGLQAGDEDVDDRPLSDEEIAGFVRLLVIAGASTTYRAYGNLMFALLTHPDQLAQVRADRSLVRGAIEESLRLEQPLVHWGRTALRDGEVQGVPVPAGSPVNVNVGAANHDPARFPDPERFDIRRANAERHLSFGFGVHRCLGIHLAQAELVTLLDRTLDVLPDLHLDPDAEGVEMTGLGFRMPTRLPVRYTPTTV